MTDEIREYLRSVIARPQMYGGSPEQAEGIVQTLAVFLVGLERGCSLAEAASTVFAEIRDLTKDVPKERSQGVLLCNETVIPERRATFECLRRRSKEPHDRLFCDLSVGEPDNKERDEGTF